MYAMCIPCLQVAICAEGGPTLDTAAASYPDFGQLCASAGFQASTDGVGLAERPEPVAKKRKKGGRSNSNNVPDPITLVKGRPLKRA